MTSLILKPRKSRVEELRARIEGFGGVNMMALEELAENEARLLFLTTQRQDIVDSISSTEEALREIKRRSRERFRHAFEQINKNFSELFQELFGGGKGEMSLIEADDVLEVRHRCDCATAGQTSAERAAALRRRKSDGRAGAGSGNLPLPAFTVLFAGRSRRAA